ncbi:MAG: gamma-glutamyltransferase, partial [Myxococcota bacterium]
MPRLLRNLALAVAGTALLSVALLFSARAWFAEDDAAPERGTGRRELSAARSPRSMVVAAHPLATEAGLEVLEAGGSALDAAVAVQAMLTLVEPQSSGIGGGAFLLHFDPERGELDAFDGRETAPRAATPELFLREDGRPRMFLEALVGGRSVGVPGVLRML